MTGDNPDMARRSHSTADQARGWALAISAISFCEIALLAAKKRLDPEEEPAILRRELLDTGVIEIPLSGNIAILAVELERMHSDPADRFIIAIAHGATLMTADRTLLRWRHKLPQQNATR